jgi:hypothetical protein
VNGGVSVVDLGVGSGLGAFGGRGPVLKGLAGGGAVA